MPPPKKSILETRRERRLSCPRKILGGTRPMFYVPIMKKGRQKPARQGRKAKKKPGGCLLSRHEGSIIGVRELDFRVRYGNGYFLSTMATGHMYICPSRALLAAQAVPADARVLLSLCMGPGSAPAESTIWSSLTTY